MDPVFQVAAQTFVNAISASLIYILFALGLTLIFGIFEVLNFAHGELVMLGGYVTYFVYGQGGLPYWLALVAACLVVSVFGIGLEKAIFYPMRFRHHLDPSLATFGVIGIVQTGALILWGGMPRGVPALVSGEVTLGSLVFPLERGPIIIGALVMMAFLFYFIRRTKVGLAVRAVQQDQEAASLQGINISNIRMVTWIVASCLSAVAGVLLVPTVYVDPFMGGTLILKGLAIVILGGLGSLPGAIVGGFALGFLDTYTVTYFGTYSYLVAFAAIILVLLVRPRGIMGTR